MKIGLVGCYSQSYRDVFSTFLILRSLETLLQSEGHETETFSQLALQSATSLQNVDRLVLVGNPFEEPRSPWSQWLVSVHPEMAEKITLVGVKDLKADALLDEQKEVLRRIAKTNPISVSEKFTRDELASIVGAKGVALTGLPCFWAEGRPLRLKKKTRLFAPAASDSGFSKSPRAYKKLLQRFYRRWNQTAPVLYSGLHSDCMNVGAARGEMTFFQPAAPEFFLTALASSDAVVSGHTAELLVAIQHSVPAILLSNDPSEKAMAEALGIPFLESHRNSQSAELVHRVEEHLARYPWETVKQRTVAMIEKTSEFLADVKLVKRASAYKRRSTAVMADKHWATVASEKNIAKVLGWAENLFHIYEGRNHFHILCENRTVEAALEASLRPGAWTAYSFKDLWSEDEWQSCRRFSSENALRASKARLLLHALENSKSEIVYSDCEVVFFRDPVELSNAAQTPFSLIARYADNATTLQEKGLYSSSLFSVQPSATPFLHWWSGFCLAPETIGQNYSQFNERTILDSAPLLFPEVKVVREPLVLAEPTNLQSLSAERGDWPGNRITGLGNQTIAAFLANGFDSLHAHEIKTGWDQLANVFIQPRNSAAHKTLLSEVWSQQRLHWSQIDDFFRAKEWLENHVPLLSHSASSAEVAFYSYGTGRVAVRLATWLGCVAPPLGAARPQSVSLSSLWMQWQKTLLRGRALVTSESSRHTQVA